MDAIARSHNSDAPHEHAPPSFDANNNRSGLRTVEASDGLSLQIIGNRASFDELEAPWNDLFERAGTPTNVFQAFGFCWNWANHYLGESEGGIPGVELSVIAGWRNGKLVVIWPLVSQRVRGISQIFWMGEPVSQYGDVLIDDQQPDSNEILAQSFEFLRQHANADLLRLRRVRADARVRPVLEGIGATIADRQIAPFMNLASAPDFATFEQRYSGSTRRNRRRLARRLEEKGSMEFVRLRGGSRARQLAEKSIALKSEWLKSRGLVSNAIADQRMTRLFGDLAEGKNKPVDCVVAGLISNGEPAALEVSFICKRHLAMHLIVFNLEFEKSGAGVLLLENSLKDGYTEKLETYDMLAPGDSYKLDWCDQTTEIIDWVKPLSLRGHLYARLYLGFLRQRIKTALKTMPQPLRQVFRRGHSLSTSMS